MNKPKLIAFIYLLGRDCLPLGKIEEIAKSISVLDIKGPIFSNKQLGIYAEDVARRLLEDPPIKEGENEGKQNISV